VSILNARLCNGVSTLNVRLGHGVSTPHVRWGNVLSIQNFRQCVGSVTVWVHRSSPRMLVHVMRTLYARHTIASQTRPKLRTDGAISCLLSRQKATSLCPPPPIFHDRDSEKYVFSMLCAAGVPLFDKSVSYCDK
jgi:hypothetical protein